ncbi:hypothetical protein DFH08DRAFT_811862 [Mycena albidolilacea]|uniref:Uncharacterized protein n=1 Tax=Mycena albidolilacea TaxID=1033008 RepID=A0AAD7EMN9_9AGAR|nr:hypothetical protein DFH08DRAFT_811862 [Mycena albidolilacea]
MLNLPFWAMRITIAASIVRSTTVYGTSALASIITEYELAGDKSVRIGTKLWELSEPPDFPVGDIARLSDVRFVKGPKKKDSGVVDRTFRLHSISPPGISGVATQARRITAACSENKDRRYSHERMDGINKGSNGYFYSPKHQG